MRIQANYLMDHAIANVWCEPSQDTEVIIRPARITPAPGVTATWDVMWTAVALPDKTSRWHIYQIGQLHPLILKLLPKTTQWVSFAESCNAQRMICDIYTEFGINLPRFDTFYQYGQDRNLMIAVRKNNNFSYDFNADHIFLRVYSNSWYNENSQGQPDNFIKVQGATAKFNSDIIALQTAQTNYQALPGAVYSFVNGVWVDKIDLITMKVGDTAEFVYDASIYKTVDFNIGTLPTFTSILDAKMKYLLHYPGPDANRIDFQDDVDAFLIQVKPNTRKVGLYYHKNAADSMRNLTHRDYSVVVPYIVRYSEKMQIVSALDTPVDPTQWILRLHIRQAGFGKPLTFENNRIHELYKLQENDIVRAMVGFDATVPVWQAANLEASGYTELMRSKYADITVPLVEKAFGYNAMAKITGDNPSPTFTQSSQLVCNVPYQYQRQSTAYEYDATGYMIGWYIHPIGSVYHARNTACANVEFINGTGGTLLDERYNFLSYNVGVGTDYRVYTSPIEQGTGLPTNVWTDVTDVPNLYAQDADGIVSWLSPDLTLYPLIRSERRFLAYDLNLSMERGQLAFSLTHLQLRGDTSSNWVMQIPMGQLDLFLNGKSLIKDVDWFMDFPRIVVTNKEYLAGAPSQVQKFHIRFVGFCTSDMQIDTPTDSGYIKYGLMSENGRYDLRDDRVLRIVLDGKLKTRSDILFGEDHQGISFSDPINGRPYQIRDMIVKLENLIPDDLYKEREKSRIIDQQVSDYLSLRLPEPEPEGPDQIQRTYQIFSPFCCKLIYDLADGNLVIPPRVGAYGRTFVSQVCQPYEALLALDPIRVVDTVDANYVSIHPHSLFTVIRIPFAGYKFMEEVVKYYSNDLVKLSPFLAIV